ncbi:MAG: DNA translocase FtsK 4TM domain-containing protein [Chitinophagales bacterium]
MAATKKAKKTIKKAKFNFLKDERIKRIFGLILLLLSFLLFVSFVSHIFTGNADQAMTSEIVVDNLEGEIEKVQANNALGIFGAAVSKLFMTNMFGLAAFFLSALIFVYGFNLMLAKKYFKLKRITYHSIFLMFFLAAIFEFFRTLFFDGAHFHPGGSIGYSIAGTHGFLPIYFKMIGTTSILLVLGLIYFIWTFDIKFDFLKKKAKAEDELKNIEEEKVPVTIDESIFEKDNLELEPTTELMEFDTLKKVNKAATKEKTPKDELTLEIEEQGIELINKETTDDGFDIIEPKTPIKEPEEDLELKLEASASEKIKAKGTTENYDPTLDLSNYKFPVLEYLEEHGSNNVRIDKEELENNKNQIVQTLLNYKIEISKIRATVGPTVTLYEIIPAPGVRISKIKSLEDDIALSLAALGIRIIAPIPGKGTIGIEVPNVHKEIVSMRSVLASEAFKNTKADLPIGLGKNIANEVIIADLAKMPHMLMAGATGQGKSVGINAVLVSLLYKKHPSQLKFVLVDPKKVELSIYSIIEKHFLAKLPGEEEAIITDVSRVVATLNSLCIEMDERYDLLKKAKARNLKEYNKKFIQRELNPLNGHKYMPFIVLVVDEFADLIMTAGKEVETPIARLAQLARAIGIHLILATQRPSVNIITGVIKANFPARISFKVASKIDSRTILDAGGADQLIGRGDLLFSQGSDIKRVQCAFVDTPEVEKIVNHIGEQQAYPSAFILPEYVDPNAEPSDPNGVTAAKDRDVLFEDAARVIVMNQVGSTSLIQRRLKLGYNRAGRLMDQLEEVGIVGKNAGSKAREVLVKTEADLEQYLQILKENRQ